MTDIVPVPNWGGVRQLETNEYATGGLNGNMNEQAKSLAGQNMYSRLYAGLPFDPVFTAQVGGFPIGGRASLENGDIVRSTVANNTVDPNVDMTGWVSTSSAESINYSLSSFYENRSLFDVISETKSIYSFLVMGENYTNENFDWSPVYARAIQYIVSSGGGKLHTPHKSTPYALNGIVRTDGQLVGIEIPFTGGSDFGATAIKVDFVCESQAVKFVPLQNDMIVFRHASSYCEVGKFQIHHNDKLRCTGFALTPQSWTNPASSSQQSHNYIHDIYSYGMLEGWTLQSGGVGGCYYNTFVNCFAVGTVAQGGRGLALKTGIRSTGQVAKASPPNRNRFYNFKTFSTNVGLDIQSGDTNYFYGFSSENNTRTGVFSATPIALKIANSDTEGLGVQGNVFFGLSIEGATWDAEISSDRTKIYGHTLHASKSTLSSTFVSGGNGTISGCYDATVFPEINNGFIDNIGGVLPSGLPTYETGRTDALGLGQQDLSGRFKTYTLSLAKFENVAVVSNSVSYVSKNNKRVNFECRFNFRPTANNSTIYLELPFTANFLLYSGLGVNEQAFAIPIYIQAGAVGTRQLHYARIVSRNGTTATHLEVTPPSVNWNVATDGQYNIAHIQLNYRSS